MYTATPLSASARLIPIVDMSATNTGTLIGEERSDTWMHLVVPTAATAVTIVAAIVAATATTTAKAAVVTCVT